MSAIRADELHPPTDLVKLADQRDSNRDGTGHVCEPVNDPDPGPEPGPQIDGDTEPETEDDPDSSAEPVPDSTISSTSPSRSNKHYAVVL